MPNKKEGVVCVYNNRGELVAIIKRDDLSKKHLVYLVQEAGTDEIADLIANKNEYVG